MIAPAIVELGSLDVIIPTFGESAWETSATRAGLRRGVLVLAVAMVVAGPFVVGGTVAWMMTREARPALGDDGWLRMRPTIAGTRAGAPLVSAAELAAAGLSVDDAGRILLR